MKRKFTLDDFNLTPQELHVLNLAEIIIITTQDMAKQYAFDTASALLSSGLPMRGKFRDIHRECRDYERRERDVLMGYASGNYSDHSLAPLELVADINDAFDDVTRQALQELEDYTVARLAEHVPEHTAPIGRLYAAYNLAVAAEQIRKGTEDKAREVTPRVPRLLARATEFSIRPLTFRLSVTLDNLRHWHHDAHLEGPEFDRLVLNVFTPYVDTGNIERVLSQTAASAAD